MGETKSDAKDFLKQVEVFDTHINNLLEDRETVWAMATKMTSALKGDTGSSGGGNHDKMSDAVFKLLALEKEIDQAVDDYIAKKREVDKVLSGIKDANQLRVLHLHYIGVHDERTKRVHYLKWSEIAEKMNYTERHVTRLHGWALQKVTALLKEAESGGNKNCLTTDI